MCRKKCVKYFEITVGIICATLKLYVMFICDVVQTSSGSTIFGRKSDPPQQDVAEGKGYSQGTNMAPDGHSSSLVSFQAQVRHLLCAGQSDSRYWLIK